MLSIEFGIPAGFQGGGSMFGISTDGKMAYVTDGNPQHIANELICIEPLCEAEPVGGGFISAVKLSKKGKIIWQQRDPNAAKPYPQNTHAKIYGSTTLANGVLYAASLGNTLMAFDAKTGERLFDFTIDGAGFAPPAIDRGTLYWATGFSSEGLLFGSQPADGDDLYDPEDNKLYSFELPE